MATGIEPGASCMLDKFSTSLSHSQSPGFVLMHDLSVSGCGLGAFEWQVLILKQRHTLLSLMLLLSYILEK